jgi:phosphatidylglycerol:prolipoprotein diacylglycerol transferase
MTVYPLEFHIGPLTVTGFGIMMMAGFLTAGWVAQRDLIRRNLNGAYAEYLIIAAVIGGIIGAKLWYVALTGQGLFSRSGLVWYGGFVGGTAAVLLTAWWHHVPIRLTMEIGVPGVAVGHALGRVGCFLVQDDYGVPTDLPWGMRFPEGMPPSTAQELRAIGVDVPADALPTDVLAVHPTQLYEVAALMFIFWLVWRLYGHKHGMGWVAAVYFAAVGLERFLIEFIRAKDDRFLGPLTVAQAMSVFVFLVGATLVWAWWKREEIRIPPNAIVVAKPERAPR